jgi:hypothetical protein
MLGEHCTTDLHPRPERGFLKQDYFFSFSVTLLFFFSVNKNSQNTVIIDQIILKAITFIKYSWPI